MKFELDDQHADRLITAYHAGWIKIGEMRIERPCLVTIDGVLEASLPNSPAELEVAHFAAVVERRPEIVLLGTGARQQFADYGITQHLAGVGIGLETMDTGAACRSYNILVGEGRSVAAMLYMI